MNHAKDCYNAIHTAEKCTQNISCTCQKEEGKEHWCKECGISHPLGGWIAQDQIVRPIDKIRTEKIIEEQNGRYGIESPEQKCECASCKAGHKNGHNVIHKQDAPASPREEWRERFKNTFFYGDGWGWSKQDSTGFDMVEDFIAGVVEEAKEAGIAQERKRVVQEIKDMYRHAKAGCDCDEPIVEDILKAIQ